MYFTTAVIMSDSGPVHYATVELPVILKLTVVMLSGVQWWMKKRWGQATCCQWLWVVCFF